MDDEVCMCKMGFMMMLMMSTPSARQEIHVHKKRGSIKKYINHQFSLKLAKLRKNNTIAIIVGHRNELSLL